LYLLYAAKKGLVGEGRDFAVEFPAPAILAGLLEIFEQPRPLIGLDQTIHFESEGALSGKLLRFQIATRDFWRFTCVCRQCRT
jgi:hypothetical protein